MRRIWPTGGGIYAIEIAEQPVYIGRANVFSFRFGTHLNALKNGKSKNRALQAAYDATGSCSFKVLEVIEGRGKRFEFTIERAWIL